MFFNRFAASSFIPMRSYTNSDLLQGIIKQDQLALDYLYLNLFPKVNKLIKNLGGDYDTANDIFQEAIILIFKKAQSNELDENLLVEGFVMGVCKLIWTNISTRNTKKYSPNNIPIDIAEDSNQTIVNEYLHIQRRKVYLEHFDKLNDDCKTILMAFFNGNSYAEIALTLGLVSEDYARRRKYLCKEYLVKSIKNDPRFENLIYDFDEELF